MQSRDVWRNGMAFALGAAVAALCCLPAGAIVLQEAVDSYSGCQDAHIGNGGYGDDNNLNVGTAPTLLLNSEHYNPG
jgi:hypothetical protein